LPSVIIEKFMKGAGAAEIWRIARKLTDYPKFMNQVISVVATNPPAGESRTSWTVLFNGNELRWTETDKYDEAAMRVEFDQIDGDLAEWRGSFQAVDHAGGTLARYVIEFDLGVPALAHVLHPLGERAIRANCEQMLAGMEIRMRDSVEHDPEL